MRFSPFYPLPGNLVCQSFLKVEATGIINYMKAISHINHINTQNSSFKIITFLVFLHSIHHCFLLLLSLLHHLYLNLAQNWKFCWNSSRKKVINHGLGTQNKISALEPAAAPQVFSGNVHFCSSASVNTNSKHTKTSTNLFTKFPLLPQFLGLLRPLHYHLLWDQFFPDLERRKNSAVGLLCSPEALYVFLS